MKQKFSETDKKNFEKYFKIKKKPGKIEKEFLEKTAKYIKYIKWIPGIEMIGVGNSVSMNSASKASDIDLYIVTKKNRLWIVRIFVSFIFQILGVRKTSKKHSKRFCLSFFSTKKAMDFKKFAIKNDIYLYFRILYFKPILSYNNCYELFLEKNNSWADFRDYKEILKENKKYIKYKKNTKNKKNKFLDLLEKILKKIFLKKTLKNYKKLGKPYGVIINDDLLKFHNNDIRREIMEELVSYQGSGVSC